MPPAPSGSGPFSFLLLRAHSTSDVGAGCGSRLRPLGLTDSSTMNPVQENNDRGGWSVSSWWQLRLFDLGDLRLNFQLSYTSSSTGAGLGVPRRRIGAATVRRSGRGAANASAAPGSARPEPA